MLTHRVDGSGPPLLLLNGGLMSIGAWQPILPGLASDHTVVRCDFRGQLLSPGDPPPALDGHAADLVALLDGLGLTRVDVVGTSFGAMTGLTLAAAHPDRVRSLVAATATDVVPADLWDARGAFRDAVRAALSGGDGGRVMDLIAPVTFSPGYLARTRAGAEARRAQVAALPRSWFAALEGLLGATLGLDLRPILGKVRCPVLVLCAGEDATFPVERSRALAAALPRATLEIVPGSGHALVVEQPDAFVSAVRAFLARLGEEGLE